MSAYSWLSSRGQASKSRRDRRRARPSRFAPGVVGLEGRLLLSTVVSNTHDSGPGSFRYVVTNAPPDATITFAPSVVGTITLTSGPVLTPFGQDLTIDGPGASELTISGGGKSSILVAGGNTAGSETVNVSGLTFADANTSSDVGGGVALVDFGATMTISNSVFTNNQAGAIDTFPGTVLDLNNDQFTGNSADYYAGAIFCEGPTTITSSAFTDNRATFDEALGGAVHVTSGASLSVTGSTFVNNQALGSEDGEGGAIFGDYNAVVTIDSSQFLDNLAGGVAISGVSGGAVDVSPGTNGSNTEAFATTITNSLFSGNRAEPTNTSGFGSMASGGAITNGGGILALSGSTFVNNQAVGGSGLAGGQSYGGAVYAFDVGLELSSDSFVDNEARGGSGPEGGAFAAGGAVNTLFGSEINNAPPSSITNTRFIGNSAVAGTGGNSSDFANGGALSVNYAPTTVTNSTFVGNSVVGSAGVNGGAGGVADGGAIEDIGSIMTVSGGLISGNTALAGSGGDSNTGAGGVGGQALGGGIDNQGGTLKVSGVTILGNVAEGGAGGQGSTVGGMGGDGDGGGIASDTTLVVTGGLITSNSAVGGDGGPGVTPGDDGQGFGGGIAVVGGTGVVSKAKVVGNHASTSGNNLYGPIT